MGSIFEWIQAPRKTFRWPFSQDREPSFVAPRGYAKIQRDEKGMKKVEEGGEEERSKELYLISWLLGFREILFGVTSGKKHWVIFSGRI